MHNITPPWRCHQRRKPPDEMWGSGFGAIRIRANNGEMTSTHCRAGRHSDGNDTSRRAQQLLALSTHPRVCPLEPRRESLLAISPSHLHHASSYVPSSIVRTRGMPLTDGARPRRFYATVLHLCWQHVSRDSSTHSTALLKNLLPWRAINDT